MFAALCQRAHPLKHSLAESIFVSRIHIRQPSQKNSEKIFRQPKNSSAGSLISRGIGVILSANPPTCLRNNLVTRGFPAKNFECMSPLHATGQPLERTMARRHAHGLCVAQITLICRYVFISNLGHDGHFLSFPMLVALHKLSSTRTKFRHLKVPVAMGRARG